MGRQEGSIPTNFVKWQLSEWKVIHSSSSFMRQLGCFTDSESRQDEFTTVIPQLRGISMLVFNFPKIPSLDPHSELFCHF